MVSNDLEGANNFPQRGRSTTGHVMTRKTTFLGELESDTAGQRVFLDSHGRMLQTFHPVAGMADMLSIMGADGKIVLELEFDGVTFHKVESDASGRVFKDTFIDPDSGDVIVVDHRLDQVTTFKDEADGAVTAIVFKDGTLSYTESIAGDGTVKRVVYEHNGRVYAARTSKIIAPSNTARTSFVYGTTDQGRRLIFVSHAINKEKTEWKFDGSRQPFELSIMTPGANTVLKRLPKTDLLEGMTLDANGGFLWDVTMDGTARLILRDESSGTEPAVIKPKWDGAGYKGAVPVVENVQWDLDAGALERFEESGERVLQYFYGRQDKYGADGSILWSDGQGERSCLSPQGDVVINHADGTSEFMSSGSIEKPAAVELYQQDQALTDNLSDVELAFLQNHGNNIDPRDFLRMHCRLRSKPHQIDGLLKQLDEFSNLDNASVSPEQIQLLCANLLHHVAYPQEVYQGRCPATAAAAIQIDFVIENPTRYVAIVKECLRTGQLRLVGGTTVPMDIENLLAADCTGRDIASRVFQIAVFRCTGFPDKLFENTRIGIGVNTLQRTGVAPNLEAMSAEEISNTIFSLGGGEACVLEVRQAAELFAAYRATGYRTMILAVNSALPPFELTASPWQHQLVNVLSCDSARKLYQLCDPAGNLRRSSGQFDESLLFRNMVTLEDGDDRSHGLAIVHGGAHGRRFVISAGSLVRRR